LSPWLITACWGVAPATRLTHEELHDPGQTELQTAIGFASALVLMTVATGFTKVELSGTGELRIEKTGTESLTISAEDNILPRLTSKVSGDTLILGTKPTTIVTTKPITYSLP
jgi:hypothetical protein